MRPPVGAYCLSHEGVEKADMRGDDLTETDASRGSQPTTAVHVSTATEPNGRH
jgi:hypothetical protein